jgi:hypothetical protein
VTNEDNGNEYDRLKAQKDKMLTQEAIKTCGDLCAALHKQRAAEYAAAIRELTAALRKYGRHDAGCMYYHHGKDGPCTCGLDALIEKYTTTDAEGMR